MGLLAMDANTVFTAIPCFGCASWKRDQIMARVGAFYLRALAGERVEPPPLSAMLKNCCRAKELGAEEGASITFMPGPPDRGDYQPQNPWKKSWW
jgi:hypothetical protein